MNAFSISYLSLVEQPALLPVAPTTPLNQSATTARETCSTTLDESVTASLETWPISAVAAALLKYLSSYFGVEQLRYRRSPVPVVDGWETCIYLFQLAETPGLPRDFLQPLSLRVFSGTGGVPVVRAEFAVLRHLRQLGYPVPRSFHREDDCRFLNGPFLLQEQVPGESLMSLLLHRPWRTWFWLRQMARAHARLHRLAADGFPTAARVLPATSLKEMGQLIRLYRLDDLNVGYEWLVCHAPAAGPSRILHLDFHPLNLIWRPDQGITVLDWTAAAVGDPHADVATTLMLLCCAPVATSNRWEERMVKSGRALLASLYLRAYQQRIRLDPARLRYYQAWAALRRLVSYGRWLRAGPQVTGAKPSLLRRLQAPHFRLLARYFEKCSGIALPGTAERPPSDAP